MTINLEKFGTMLISRQTGKEAYLALQPLIRDIKRGEDIEIDFSGVSTFSPSWGDEFLTPLLNRYGKNIILKNTDNPSVKATIEVIETVTKKKFKVFN